MARFVATLALLLVFPDVGRAASSLDWQKVAVENGKSGMKKVTFTGHADPRSEVKVDRDGIIVVSPDPSDQEADSQLSFPLMYPEYLKARGLDEGPAAEESNEIAITIRECELRAKPDKASKRSGKVGKGKKLRAKPYNEKWVKLVFKGKTYFLPASCVGFGPEKNPHTTTARADSNGDFTISLNLPPGVLQVPVELMSNAKIKSFVASVEIRGDEVPLAKRDEKPAEATRPPVERGKPEEKDKAPETPRSYKIVIAAGAGGDNHSFEQTVPSGTFSFSNSGSVYGAELGIEKPTWALRVNYRHAQGSLTAKAPLTFGRVNYNLDHTRLSWLKLPSNSKWQYVLAADMASSPLVQTDGSTTSVVTMKSTFLVVGAAFELSDRGSFSQLVRLNLLGPLDQTAGNAHVSGVSGIGVEAGYLGRYRLKSRYFFDGELNLSWHKDTLKDSKRSLVETIFGARLGVEF